MPKERQGIARTAIVVVVVVIIAIAGVGAYFGLMASGSNSSSTLNVTTSTTSTSSPQSTQTTTSTSATSSASSSTNPTSTTSIISSSSSTSTSTLTTVCPSTSTSSPAQPASVIIPLLNAYSAITQTLTGTLNGTAYNFTASYTLAYVSSTTYKVNIVDKTPSHTYSPTVWLLMDGTVEALYLDGHNYTGSSAGAEFQTYFLSWENELNYEQQITTSSSFSYFHSTGTSTVTAGPTTFTVTNYAENSQGETIPLCNGTSITLTTGTFSIGSPSGSSYQLMTYLDVAGSKTGTSGSSTYNFVSQVTSATVA